VGRWADELRMPQLDAFGQDARMNPRGLRGIVYIPTAAKSQMMMIRQSGALYARHLLGIDNLIKGHQ
jgi:hypothetical protein